ncbi:MAG TPA: AI-2E family transporter [Longimicrobiales bacterium]|nr:AI-2E family transporter [Longimicrobiales bacterium]
MTTVKADRQWPSLYVVIAALGALAFFFSVKSVLSPVIAFIVLLVLISPWSGTRQHSLTVISASFLLFIWLFATLGSLLAPFILALAFAYILDPLVDRLVARGVKRGLATMIVVLPVIVLFILGVVFGVPAAINQIGELVDSLPKALQRGQEALPPAIRERIGPLDTERIIAMVSGKQTAIANKFWGAVVGVGKGVKIALNIVGYLVLTPVLTIYLLNDFDRITATANKLIPKDKRATWIPFTQEYHTLLSGYLRGQFIEATIVGVLTWLGLMILGFPYSGLIGFIAGLLNVIPYVGLIVSAVPAVLIALLSGDIVSNLMKVGGVFFVVQLIDGTITGPRIVGGSVGLHPVWVILALAVGGSFFGFAGLLIAMPVAVFIKLAARNFFKLYNETVNAA